jgi:hypothetical protein
MEKIMEALIERLLREEEAETIKKTHTQELLDKGTQFLLDRYKVSVNHPARKTKNTFSLYEYGCKVRFKMDSRSSRTIAPILEMSFNPTQDKVEVNISGNYVGHYSFYREYTLVELDEVIATFALFGRIEDDQIKKARGISPTRKG